MGDLIEDNISVYFSDAPNIKYHSIEDFSNLIKLYSRPSQNHLSLLHFNARSLYNRIPDLEILVNHFLSMESDTLFVKTASMR